MDSGTILGFVALCLSGLGSLFSILALGLNTWQSYLQVTSGLWKFCISGVCTSYSGDVGSSMEATRAMMFLGMFCMLAVAVAVVVFVFIMKENGNIHNLAIGMAIVSGFFLMIGFGIYANKLKDSRADYGAGFGLAVLSWILAWTIGGILITIKCIKK